MTYCIISLGPFNKRGGLSSLDPPTTPPIEGGGEDQAAGSRLRLSAHVLPTGGPPRRDGTQRGGAAGPTDRGGGEKAGGQ